MSEVPPESQDEAQGGPSGPPGGAVPGGNPTDGSAPPRPEPARGPFADLFSERQAPATRAIDGHSAFDAETPDVPLRTPWHPPEQDPAAPGAEPAQRTLPLEDPYAGITSPYGPYAGVPAEVPPAPPPARRSIARPAGRLLREVAETVILALVIFLLVRAVVQNFQVEGRSMEPSLESGWYLLVDKALYWEVNLNTVHKFVPFVHPGDDPTRFIFRGPKRGDIIVFVAPDQAPGAQERDFIKRVIGLPGDTIEVKNCTVFVNGQPIAENYIEEAPAYTYGPTTVPKDEYFVLGDNRNNSSDSHSWGFVPKANIIGQAWVIYWPFHHFGLVRNVDIKPGSDNNAPAGAKQPAFCASPQ